MMTNGRESLPKYLLLGGRLDNGSAGWYTSPLLTVECVNFTRQSSRFVGLLYHFCLVTAPVFAYIDAIDAARSAPRKAPLSL